MGAGVSPQAFTTALPLATLQGPVHQGLADPGPAAAPVDKVVAFSGLLRHMAPPWPR